MHGSVYVHIVTFVKVLYIGNLAAVQVLVEALSHDEKEQLFEILRQQLI